MSAFGSVGGDRSPKPSYKVEEFIRFNPDRGTVDTLIDEQVRHQIEVRKGIEEEFIRSAVIAELERLGYVVMAPGDSLVAAVRDLATQFERDADSGEYRGGSYAASVLKDVARRMRALVGRQS